MKRVINKEKRVVVISDLHCGHMVGLTHPEYQVNYSHSSRTKRNKSAKIQRDLWEHFEEMVDDLGKVDVLIINGDTIDGKGQRSGGSELITSDREEQCEMAVAAIEEFACDNIIMTYGTPYHVGINEDWENKVAKDLGVKKIGSHEWIDVNGCIFDVKHKVGSSSVPYSRSTAVAKERFWNLLWNEDEEQPKGDIVIRSHVHYHSYVGGVNYLAMTTPALQAMGTKFGSRQCSGTVDWGLVYFDVDENGGYSWESKTVKLEAQKARAIKL